MHNWTYIHIYIRDIDEKGFLSRNQADIAIAPYYNKFYQKTRSYTSVFKNILLMLKTRKLVFLKLVQEYMYMSFAFC